LRPVIGNDIAMRHVNGRVHRVGVVTKILGHLPFLLFRISWIVDEGVSDYRYENS